MMRWLACLLLCLAPAFAHAEERIDAYEVTLQVQADGSLDVTEKITVTAEGNRIRRGITREFPTRYKDRFGNAVVAGFQVLGVQRDGQAEPWFTQDKANGVVINTGNDDFLPVPAQYTYTLHYRTTRQLGFFEDNDELYFNAIPVGSIFQVDKAQVEVRLPQAVPVERMHAEAYTGRTGARGEDYDVQLPQPGVATFRSTRALLPGEGVTIVVTFPKGLVTAPSQGQKTAWFFRDNAGVLVALLGWIGLIAFCVLRWNKVGRDPPPGVVVARYVPPQGLGPADLRYVREMGQDTRCFSSDVLALAVAGHLTIDRDDGLLTDTWTLEKCEGVKLEGLTASQRALLTMLFSGGARLVLKDKQASVLSAANTAQTRALYMQFQPAMFSRNVPSILLAVGIAVAVVALAALVGGASGVPALVAVGLGMLITLLVFGSVVKAPTPAGRRLLDEIEGLRLYLSVAERDDLARLRGPEAPPQLDAERFEQLLPYAVALEVEDAWTKKFTAAVGTAAAVAATSQMAWYHGGGSNLGNFAHSLGNSFSSQIASASTPPGSSSGSGGGGFSGGGGGGGGVGGR